MTVQIAVHGWLVDDPQVKQTNGGTPVTLACVAIPLPCSQADDEAATIWLSVPVLGKQVGALERHRKDELLGVAGNMQTSQWTGQNGGARQGWQVIADSVINVRTARLGGKKGRQGQATDTPNKAEQQVGNNDPYEDNMPF